MRLLALVMAAVLLVACGAETPNAGQDHVVCDTDPAAWCDTRDIHCAWLEFTDDCGDEYRVFCPCPDAAVERDACVPEVGVDWCARLSVACDETLTFNDNCGIQHSITCHNCPDASTSAPDAAPGLDAASPGLDAGEPGLDASVPLDAAEPGLDASQLRPDAAQPGQDAGSPGKDASVSCDDLDCYDGNDCTQDTCSNGVCQFPVVSMGSSCRSGLQYGSCTGTTCCVGCLTSTGQCFAGTTVEACGAVNSTCKSCDDGDPCTTDECISPAGNCRHTYLGEYASCGASSLCYASQCIACGGVGQSCCPGSTCGAGAYCDPVGYLTGTCKTCGGRNERCCPGHACGSGLGCENYSETVEGFCRCGWTQYSACCADGTCDGTWLDPYGDLIPYSCYSGICQ